MYETHGAGLAVTGLFSIGMSSTLSGLWSFGGLAPKPPLKYLLALSITSSPAFLERSMTLVFNFLPASTSDRTHFSDDEKCGSNIFDSGHSQDPNDRESGSYQVAKQTMSLCLLCPTECRKLPCTKLGALVVISVFPSRCRVRKLGVVVVITYHFTCVL